MTNYESKIPVKFCNLQIDFCFIYFALSSVPDTLLAKCIPDCSSRGEFDAASGKCLCQKPYVGPSCMEGTKKYFSLLSVFLKKIYFRFFILKKREREKMHNSFVFKTKWIQKRIKGKVKTCLLHVVLVFL